jgi:hypothetical protein
MSPFAAGTSARRTTRGRGGETYVRMKGKWMYLYRAMDSCDATIDFLLSAKRDLATAQRFLTKTVGSENHPEPRDYRHPRSAILLQKQEIASIQVESETWRRLKVSKASIAKIVCVSLPHLSLYQNKAVTPTPLKDIFTPIWAGP